MTARIDGLHHVTVMAKDPSQNVRFYTRVLGLRFVKRTVNFDDPSVYHTYFGDRLGRPGTIITFFPHPLAARGADGASEVSTTVYCAPPGSLGFWQGRLRANGLTVETRRVFGLDRLTFRDHDSTRLAICEADFDAPDVWADHGVPEAHALRTIERVVMTVPDMDASLGFLTGTLGFEPRAQEGDRAVLTVREGGASQRVEVVEDKSAPRARLGAGSVHHVAWRVADRAAHRDALAQVAAARRAVTPVQDRKYFESIYFREPGGVLFEIATQGPGFTVDEAEDALGASLTLPPVYEGQRETIERALPPIRV